MNDMALEAQISFSQIRWLIVTCMDLTCKVAGCESFGFDRSKRLCAFGQRKGERKKTQQQLVAHDQPQGPTYTRSTIDQSRAEENNIALFIAFLSNYL